MYSLIVISEKTRAYANKIDLGQIKTVWFGSSHNEVGDCGALHEW